MKIILPGFNAVSRQELDLKNNLVVVGANGSGKSRFGSYIEQNSSGNIKRISAQRMLRLSENVPKAYIEEAFKALISSHRHQPVTVEQNDYQHVLSALFAETAKRDSDYVKASRESTEKPDIPDSAVDKLIVIWNQVFPHRKILLDHGKVVVEGENSSRYAGTEMSDGEKIALYLIAQCLVLPGEFIIIIDEPELHLHKSLMARLWNKIEEMRSDCRFIYITHDLDFASSRSEAIKIWIKDFHNNIWDWCYLPQEDSLPENLLLEIVGSKKPILLVEGEKGSLDTVLYQIYYSGFTVIPRGSCYKVIESVKGLRSNSDLHSLEVRGLIDRDHREAEEITSLKKFNINVLSFTEIENLFLLPIFVGLMAEQMLLEDKEATFAKVMNTVISQMRNNIDRLALDKIKSRIYYKLLLGMNAKSKCIDDFKVNVSNIFDVSKIESEYMDEKTKLNKMIASEDYLEILKEYNNKGLCSLISHHLELPVKGNAYQKKIIQMLKGEKRSQLMAVLREHLPDLNENKS